MDMRGDVVGRWLLTDFQCKLLHSSTIDEQPPKTWRYNL